MQMAQTAGLAHWGVIAADASASSELIEKAQVTGSFRVAKASPSVMCTDTAVLITSTPSGRLNADGAQGSSSMKGNPITLTNDEAAELIMQSLQPAGGGANM